MPIEVIMPKVDMDMDAGRVLEWHVAEGATVEQGDALFDIETDKATMEVESPANGILHHVIAAAGAEVPIGAPVAWLYAEGEAVDAEPPVVPGQSPATGIAPTPMPAMATAPPPASRSALLQAESRLRATPAARRVARELGVPLAAVRGSGPLGRIVRADVQAAASATPPLDAHAHARTLADALGINAEAILATGAELSPAGLRGWLQQQLSRLDAYERGVIAPGPQRRQDFSRFGETQLVPLDDPARQRAGAIGTGWREVPQVTHHDEADVTALVAQAAASGGLAMLAHLLAALSATLAEHPLLGASLDERGGALVLKRYCHVALGMDHDGKLVDQLLLDVPANAAAIASRIDSELAPKVATDRDAASIDVLWLGEAAGLAVTPLVRAPCVAALAAGRVRAVGRWDGQHFARREALPLSLSYDHRAVDGAEAARFMRDLCDRLASAAGLTSADSSGVTAVPEPA